MLIEAYGAKAQKEKSLFVSGRTLIMGNIQIKKGNQIVICVFVAVILAFMYFSCSQSDIVLTGNGSWQMWNSHFTNFYEVVSEWEDSYSANYLPSTFILFAIWVLPLKLLGFEEPPTACTTYLPYIWWYKLLPALFFIAAVWLMYKIALKLMMGKVKAFWCAICFATAPVAVYSQFVFSQYDIFTVFFVLLGIYFYLDKKIWQFSLSFAFATSFKYYAIVFFVVLLLLAEKRVERIIMYVAESLSLVAVYFVIFWRSEAFKNCVLGFNAISYVEQSDFSTILGNVSFMQLVGLLICAWAYYVRPADFEDGIKWALYLCCGECFALFGLSTFHPQWLLLGVPFWTLSTFIQKDIKICFWLDTLFSVVFSVFVFKFWVGNVDDTCLYNGVWRLLLNGRKMSVHIADLIPYNNTDQLYTIIVAMLLIFFLFRHPKFCLTSFHLNVKQVQEAEPLMLIRFASGALLYIILGAACLFATMRHDPVLVLNQMNCEWQEVSTEEDLVQVFSARYPLLSRLDVSASNWENEACNGMRVQIIDMEDDMVLYTTSVEGAPVPNENVFTFDDLNLQLEVGKKYGVCFRSVGEMEANYCIGSSSSQGDMAYGYYTIRNGKESTYILSITMYQAEDDA